MNKKIILSIIIFSIVAVSIFNFSLNFEEKDGGSLVTLSNIEALANNTPEKGKNRKGGCSTDLTTSTSRWPCSYPDSGKYYDSETRDYSCVNGNSDICIQGSIYEATNCDGSNLYDSNIYSVNCEIEDEDDK